MGVAQGLGGRCPWDPLPRQRMEAKPHCEYGQTVYFATGSVVSAEMASRHMRHREQVRQSPVHVHVGYFPCGLQCDGVRAILDHHSQVVRKGR